MAADEKEPGTLPRLGDEPALVEELQAENLAGARAVFLAGSAESSRKALDEADAAADSSSVFIDLTYTAEERTDARLRAPQVESEPDEDGAAVHVIAHPAAIALALFLRRVQAHDPIRRSVIQIFAPASEYGRA